MSNELDAQMQAAADQVSTRIVEEYWQTLEGMTRQKLSQKQIEAAYHQRPHYLQNRRSIKAETLLGWGIVATLFLSPVLIVLLALYSFSASSHRAYCKHLLEHPTERSLPTALGWFESQEYKAYSRMVKKCK